MSSKNSATPSKFPIARLRLHVNATCAANGIKITFTGKNNANHDTKTIDIRPVKSRQRYAIALHEIGHLLSRSARKPRLFQEGEAWQWARDNALEWTPVMQRALLDGLHSYLQEAYGEYLHGLRKPFKLPPPDHFFWKYLKRTPQARYLLKIPPPWLHPETHAVPWGEVLAHEDRPRCQNCAFWNFAASTPNDTTEKTLFGFCNHRARPLGVELTPGGALCGVSWLRRE